MPFKNRAQLGLCYAKQARGEKGWDCDRWLRETPSLCSLSHRGSKKTRVRRRGEKIKGPIQTGPRGGRYFVITERDREGVICTVKVYLPSRRK